MPATTYTLLPTGDNGPQGTAKTFTVTPNGTYTGTITLTPTGDGAAGLSPIVLTWAASAAAKTATWTPTAAGAMSVGGTNSGGLANPDPATYTVDDITLPTVSAVTIVATPATDVQVSVLYADDVAIDGETIGDTNILITGPGSYSELVPFASADPTGDAIAVLAVYTIGMPITAGLYTVKLVADEVTDTAANAVVAQVLGTFVVLPDGVTYIGPYAVAADWSVVGPYPVGASTIGPYPVTLDHVGPYEITADHIGPYEIVTA